ncbi:MAG: response regulator [Spirochaetaceae bacterium]|nr:MAG: response regulator [Spirochaetaceae bacterium]
MSKAISILVADDEHLVRKGIRHLLADQPEYRIVADAANGKEALQKAQELKPNIIILDVKMPVMNGLETLKQMNRLSPGSKTIILSGHNDFTFAQQALKFGANDYLLKPTNLQELLAALEKAKTHILQDKDTQNHLSHGLSAITEQFYIALLRNELQVAEISEKLKSLKVQEISASVLLVSLDDRYRLRSEKSEEEYRSLCIDLKQRIKSLLDKELPRPIPVLHLDYGECVVVYFSSLKVEAVNCAEMILAEVSWDYPFTVAVGSKRSIPLINESYKDAREKIKTRLLIGGNRVISEVAGSAAEKTPYPEELENLISKAIRFGDCDQVKSTVKQMFDAVACHLTSAEAWTHLCYHLLELAYSVLSDLEVFSNERISFFEKSGEIPNLSSAEDVRYFVTRNLVDIAALIRSMNTGPSIAIRKAISYINENYANRIALQDVAHYTCLSPNYLSQLFKQETGKSFLEYLTHCRVEAAKKLLVQSNLAISEIAFKLGYDMPSYFSEVFKKSEGITPSQYRKGSK